MQCWRKELFKNKLYQYEKALYLECLFVCRKSNIFVIDSLNDRPKGPMEALQHLLLGFITSFLGTIFPSMLSMTTVKISLKEGQRKAVIFAFGVSTIVIGQAYLSVAFSKILLKDLSYLATLQKVGVVIFTGLSIYFFIQASKQKKQQTNASKHKTNKFVLGIFFSLLNMFAIPFYVGVSSSLALMDWYTFNPSNNIGFVIGSAFGTFSLLSLYTIIALKIDTKMKWLAQKMDLILRAVIALVALINIIDLLA